MAADASNLERLAAIGLLGETPVPEALQQVVEEISDEELSVLEDIYRRLAEAGGQPDRGFTRFIWY